MNREDYQKLIKSLKPREPKVKNAIISFVTGGLLGLFCEMFSHLLITIVGISKVQSYSWICFIMIGIASLLTALGFFDNVVNKLKCGLIIPTTGFAHSVTASALEFKKDGMITGLGANFFRLAGSVILYGITSSFFLVLLKVIIYG